MKKRKKEISAQEALRFHIRPLYDHHRKVALFISAKSACTTAVKWFFHHTGHLQAAQRFDRWIHQYRLQVYYKSSDYQQHLSDLLTKDYTIIKVVRNPFDRAVSSFIHGMKHSLERAQMNRVLFRRGSLRKTLFGSQRAPGGFTFREFIRYLEQVGVDEGNVHFRSQRHPLENYLPVTHLIRIEDLSSGIREVENRLGWEPTDLTEFSSSVHHTHRATQREPNAMDMRFDLFQRNDAVVPAFADFFDRSLISKVARLYEIDFKSYDFDPSPENLIHRGSEISNRSLEVNQRRAA